MGHRGGNFGTHEYFMLFCLITVILTITLLFKTLWVNIELFDYLTHWLTGMR